MPKPILIYDAECGFCAKWVAWLRKQDRLGRIELLAYQSQECQTRFPGIGAAQCVEGGKLITPSGEILSGADAAPSILRELPSWRWASYLLGIPGIMMIARPIYRSIARNRLRLSCALRMNPENYAIKSDRPAMPSDHHD